MQFIGMGFDRCIITINNLTIVGVPMEYLILFYLCCIGIVGILFAIFEVIEHVLNK